MTVEEIVILHDGCVRYICIHEEPDLAEEPGLEWLVQTHARVAIVAHGAEPRGCS
jgi:hypothetical protein